LKNIEKKAGEILKEAVGGSNVNGHCKVYRSYALVAIVLAVVIV